MLNRRELLALQAMIAGGAFVGRPFDLFDVFGSSAKAAQTNWDSGSLFHILPNVSHERALLKASFLSALTETPEILVDGRRIAGQRNDTNGLYWQFDIPELQSSTEYTLELRSGGGEALAEPWSLSTFPDPQSDIDHVRIAFYHCPGGHDVTAAANGARRPTNVRRALIDKVASFQPNAIVANGDHLYWDLYSPRFAQRYAMSEAGIAYAGRFDRNLPILGTANEDFVLKGGVEQIAPIYRTTCKSIPVFFLQDDHDYFDNDDATDEIFTFPPSDVMLRLARTVQKLAYPEFLPDANRPQGLPGTRSDEGRPEISSNFGTLRYGKLLEVLLYDNRRSATLHGPTAVHFDPTVENWLKARMADQEVTHVVNAPGQPPGWTRGNWYEYYPDRAVDGRASIETPKPYWQDGWLSQHDRIMEAIHGMEGRIPLVISGDIHKSAHGSILGVGDLDMSANPIVTMLPGSVGTGEAGLQALTHHANHLNVRDDWAPQAVNGFMIADFYRDRVDCAFYGWDSRVQDIDAIPGLQSSYSTSLRPVA
jgi:hypothetical protein